MTPYDNNTPWNLAAIKYKGTIYIAEIKTEEQHERQRTLPEWIKKERINIFKFHPIRSRGHYTQNLSLSELLYIIKTYFEFLFSHSPNYS